MGVYRYTLRSSTKRLGGHEIGQFKFAFKEGWGTDRDPVCRRLIKAGERAADKLRRMGCKLFVQGSWGDQQPVFYIGAVFGDFLEELRTCPQVGRLHQTARGRWWVELFSEETMLQLYPEIGVLQGEDGRRFYHTMRGSTFERTRLADVATDVLIMRLVNDARR